VAVRRSSIFKATGAGLALAVFATAAVIAQGFDVAQTPVDDSSIWAIQSGEGNRYARINTGLGELDTVKNVTSPNALVQTSTTALVLMEGYERVAGIDPSRPLDFDADSEDLANTPAGTAAVAATGPYVAYLTENGRVHVSRIDDGAAATPIAVDPYAEDNAVEDAEQRVFTADSVAIGEDGVLYAFSVTEGVVLRFDIEQSEVLGLDTVPSAPDEGSTSLTAVGGTWLLLSADGATAWVRGLDPVDTDLADDAVLQRPSRAGQVAYIASRSGLTALTLADGSTDSVVGGSLGIPAAPSSLDGVMYAAWLGENEDAGVLWSSVDGETSLDYGDVVLGSEPTPVLRSNGSIMILNDIESGWVWTIPDGALVPSSQDWSIVAAETETATDEEEQVSEVTERKPPVAEPDVFGVRAGQLVTLPVLLNDHDPNDDVLSIDPASVVQPDPSFGTVLVTNNAQDLAIQVAAGASGSTTFSYAITDGTETGGLLSEPTSVTLTVYGDDVNSAPVWCGVEGCLRDWPTLQVQPGSSASVEVLRGWVDPEGDPIYLASATNLGSVGSVASTPDGTVLFQHPDASAAGGTVEVLLAVSDIRGAVAEKTLSVEITATPSLGVEPFAVTAAVGEQVTIDPSRFITGVAGSYRIQSAKTEVDDGTTVAVDNGATTFGFTAPVAGDYLVSYTVADDLTEVIGVVRVIVVGDEQTQLTTSPITMFVRPKADATVDVFSAVSNPGNRVLLLTEALPEPRGGATLDVSVVNQALLRVKGSTADGQAGVLGTVRYTVTDGTGNALATAQGQATVILLPAPEALAPVAVGDAVTVRAGSQIDIPVLDNDLSPDGNTLVLNPEALIYEYDDGLAFASGRSVRLLAPAVAGEYQLTYTVYAAGSPEVSAQARVLITVLPAGDNRPPVPKTLTGRVLAGSSVSIPFDSFGVDPDGDEVRLSGIVGQPDSGSAALAAAGDAIVYTSVTGFSGPVQFSYEVTDSLGQTGEGIVRVGVLDAQSNPSPITYSDYVEVQAGASNIVTLRPAANDIDPAGTELTVSNVVPDAVADSDDYVALEALIGETTEDGVVSLTAGDVLGTKSFFYTVTNERGDVAVGLIVMKVVRESVPDFPRVADTHLTIEDRDAFSNGIDVVTGKVTWNSGNVDDLKLTLWNENSGYSVSGWKISGSLPDSSTIVPFTLTGTNVLGAEVATHGFLRIPGKDAIILALKPSVGPQQVKENESVSFDMKKLVTVPSGSSLQVDAGGISTAGKRTNASCTADGTTITYAAGLNEPWTDYCAVPVRLSGQSGYTHLIVRIEIEPEIPLPILRPAAVTMSPAAPETTYDLTKMTTWAGKTDMASLEYTISYTGDQFSVVQSGSTLTMYALDNASPGRENTVRVSLASHPEVASAALTLKVGPAPSELPKGGTVVKECVQTDSSCSVKVIGAPGEVNVFRTSLVLDSVSVPASCVGISASVADASTVRISWTGDAPGAKCQATFTVKDPQGRVSPSDRAGSLLIDFKGLPKAPAAVQQTGYDDKTVKLSVTPGGATAAYPALTGFAIYQGSTKVADCGPNGSCGPITTSANGDSKNYEARAVNSVGESVDSVSTNGSAYRPPTVDEVTLTPIYKSGTSASEGYITVRIEATDNTARGYLINGTEYGREGNVTTHDIRLAVGNHTVSVVPVSNYSVPSGLGPISGNTNRSVDVAGAPSVTSAGALSTVSGTSIAVSGTTFNDNFSHEPREVTYIALQGTQWVSCTADGDGGVDVSTSGIAQASPTFTGLTTNKVYRVVVCVSNGFGFAQADVPGTVRPVTLPTAPSGYTYTIAASGQADFLATIVPGAAPTDPDFQVVYSGQNSYGPQTSMTAKFCLTDDLSICTAATGIAAADPLRVYQLDTTSITQSGCTIGVEPEPVLTGNYGTAGYTVSVTSITYLDSPIIDLTPTTIDGADLVVPADAVTVTSISYTVTFPANAGGATYTFTGSNGSNRSCT